MLSVTLSTIKKPRKTGQKIIFNKVTEWVLGWSSWILESGDGNKLHNRLSITAKNGKKRTSFLGN